MENQQYMVQLGMNYLFGNLKQTHTDETKQEPVEIPQSYRDSIQRFRNTLPFEHGETDEYTPIYYKYLTEEDIDEMAKIKTTSFGIKLDTIYMDFFKDVVDTYFKIKLDAILKQSTGISLEPVIEIPQSYRDCITRFRDCISVDMDKTIVDELDKLIEQYTHVCYKHLNEEDIEELITFNLSPIGKKLRKVTPDMIIECMKIYSKK